MVLFGDETTPLTTGFTTPSPSFLSFHVKTHDCPALGFDAFLHKLFAGCVGKLLAVLTTGIISKGIHVVHIKKKLKIESTKVNEILKDIFII